MTTLQYNGTFHDEAVHDANSEMLSLEKSWDAYF